MEGLLKFSAEILEGLPATSCGLAAVQLQVLADPCRQTQIVHEPRDDQGQGQRSRQQATSVPSILRMGVLEASHWAGGRIFRIFRILRSTMAGICCGYRCGKV